MNSQRDTGAQYTKLQEALQKAAQQNKNVLTVWHHNRFAVGSKGNNGGLSGWWNLMDEFDVDLNLIGHEHLYVRIAPRDKNGNPVAGGTRTIIAGNGGRGLRSCTKLPKGTEICNNKDWGITLLKLYRDSYEWEMRTKSGVKDSGRTQVSGVSP
jgi:hypothetical protein